MQRERAAAALRARDDHVAALGGEHPRGRRVDPGVEHRLHAAGQHADHGPPRAARRHPLGNRPGSAADAGGASRSACSAAGETRPSRPCGRCSRSAPVRCSRAQRRGRGPQPPRVGEQREDRRPWSAGRGRNAAPSPRRACRSQRRRRARRRHAVGAGVGSDGTRRAAVSGVSGERVGPVLRPLPRRRDDLVVLHAGRAGGHARHAAEAPVEVLAPPPASAAPRRATG